MFGLNTIRGSLCILAPIPYSFSFFILFLMNLFQGNSFLFLFPFSYFLFFFFFFTRRSTGGGGGAWPPGAPPSYASVYIHEALIFLLVTRFMDAAGGSKYNLLCIRQVVSEGKTRCYLILCGQECY